MTSAGLTDEIKPFHQHLIRSRVHAAFMCTIINQIRRASGWKRLYDCCKCLLWSEEKPRFRACFRAGDQHEWRGSIQIQGSIMCTAALGTHHRIERAIVNLHLLLLLQHLSPTEPSKHPPPTSSHLHLCPWVSSLRNALLSSDKLMRPVNIFAALVRQRGRASV